MNKSAAFYIANLCADIARCVSADRENDEARYQSSLMRGYTTLSNVRVLKNWSAYEEGLLLLRGLELARENARTADFLKFVNKVAAQLLPLV